jgi:Urocanase Rossmann-like domain
LALDPIEPAAFGFILQVERSYASLIAAGDIELNAGSEPGLGGSLLYAGELDAVGRALLVAGNIAGAASLAATADAAAQKQAVRDGVADFLVTSLSEALRILKNQIRKREAVAVCVAAAAETLTWEMLERGVLPDLLRPGDESSGHSPFLSQGARQALPLALGNSILLTWRVASAPALWLPRLDAIAIDCVQGKDWSARRWLRLAPRYLGRMAQGVRLMCCDQEFKADFIEKAQAQMERGEIAVEVEIQAAGRGGSEQYRLSPHGHSETKS